VRPLRRRPPRGSNSSLTGSSSSDSRSRTLNESKCPHNITEEQCRGSGSGMGKKSRSGSGMNIPNYISESLKTIFRVKILKFFDVDPDQGII
jgi:hypothetical protein